MSMNVSDLSPFLHSHLGANKADVKQSNIFKLLKIASQNVNPIQGGSNCEFSECCLTATTSNSHLEKLLNPSK